MDNLKQLAADHPDNWPNLWIDGTGPEVKGIDRGGMPQFGQQLTPDEIATIVEYLKTLP
jgi:mono/diheme cytochrome c family protein